MARSTSLALQPPMPVSRSGVMFAPLTVYSDVSQVCGPPACSRAVSSAPPCTRGVWQLPQVRIPSTRYLPRSSGVSAAAAPAAMLSAATKHVTKRIISPLSPSFDLDVSFLHHLRPLGGFDSDIGGQFLGRARQGLDARIDQLLPERRIAHRFRVFHAQPGHCLPWRAGGHHQALPRPGLE